MVQQTPWAILLCKWNDMAVEPKDRSFFEQMFTVSGRGTFNMVDFFDDMTHGSVDIGGSQVFGWITLAENWSDYKGSGINLQGRQDLIEWATGAAINAGIDLSPFFNVIICMNATPTQGTDLFGGAGRVVCDTNVLEGSVLGQEMGHGYGLDHSRQDGSTADYCDRWDVMSTWDSCYMQPHDDYIEIGPGLNAANMAGRGWLDESRIWRSGSASFETTIQLRPLIRRDLPGYLGARLGDFIVEFRNKNRWDAAIPRPAVLVHRFEDNHSYLMSNKDGQQDLVTGSTFGDDPSTMLSPFLPYTRLEVIEINEKDEFATIRLSHRGAPSVINVGPGILFGGVAAGGDGLVFIGGKFIRIPPRSPLSRLLEQVVIHESASAVASTRLRQELQREALSTIAAIADQELRAIQPFRQPAPLQPSRDKA